ncbi:MAG: hypothetical protein RQ966_19735 [Acetobacteraceae bacterium]|nr:hypothetical protein [Acetobacteraceae bacterium]
MSSPVGRDDIGASLEDHRADRCRPRTLAPGLIVLAQALWLRPRLDMRTRQVVDGGATPPPSGLHRADVACELAALLGLGLTGRAAWGGGR